MNIRVMTIEDFDQVHALWMSIKGFGIRSVDDSKEGVERFLKRNPTTSVVAEEDGKIVGAILCGHDGRRGCLYHVCVDVNHRIESKAGKIQIIENGTAVDYSEAEATKILSEPEVTAIADVKMGDKTATAWGCDLTHGYIEINADYRS